jgi:hypothetical protein
LCHWVNGIRLFKRFSRWCDQRDIWKNLYNGCSHHPNLPQILIDSTIARAHACAAETAGATVKLKKWDDQRVVSP